MIFKPKQFSQRGEKQYLMFLFKKQEEKRIAPVSFKEMYPLEKRIERRLKFQQKYSNEKYALIVIEGLNQFDPKRTNFTIMGVELHFTVLMLMEYIRMKILNLDKNKSFYIQIKNSLRKTTDNIGYLYEKYADKDGFMYVEVKQESIF